MNQPTREEFDELKQEQERLRQEQEALKRRLEQATEPMKAINVNVASADVIARLDKLEQELSERSTTWLNTLQQNYDEHKDSLSDVKTVQSGHSKFFEEHGKRLATTATKDDITSIKATMATKEDIDIIRSDMARMEDRIIERIAAFLHQEPGDM